MSRKVDNWIDSFLELSEHVNSPPLFRKWAAISCISATLQQRVWTETFDRVYPNLYVMLVGPPGVGKTLPLRWASQFYQALDDKYEVAATSLSRASLTDHMSQVSFSIIKPGDSRVYNTLYAAIEELSTALPAYDIELVSALVQFWDCSPYRDKKRTGDRDVRIKHPQLSMLAATNPDFLTSGLPENAWEQGFMSRTIYVYSGSREYTSPFKKVTQAKLLKDNLYQDLKHIADMYGEIEFLPEAQEAVDTWASAGGNPKPDHPKLLHYVNRRPHILIKLCITASIVRGDDMRITIEDFRTALNWLLEVEQFMPDIFKRGAHPDGRLMDQTHHFLMWAQRKNEKYARTGVPERLLYAYLSEHTPGHNVQRLVDIMCKREMIERSNDGVGNTYRAKALVR